MVRRKDIHVNCEKWYFEKLCQNYHVNAEQLSTINNSTHDLKQQLQSLHSEVNDHDQRLNDRIDRVLDKVDTNFKWTVGTLINADHYHGDHDYCQSLTHSKIEPSVTKAPSKFLPGG